MNKITLDIFLKYAKLHKNFAEVYADYQPDGAKDDFYELLQTEYKKDLKAAVKLETTHIKQINKLLKEKIKADKRIMRKRKGGVAYEPEPSLKEQIFAALDEYFSQVSEQMLEQQQNEPIEQPTTDETETTGEQSGREENSEKPTEEPATSEEKPQTEQTPKSNTETEKEEQPADEVPNENEEREADIAPEIDTDEAQATSLTSEKKLLPSFYRAGGKSGKKSK